MSRSRPTFASLRGGVPVTAGWFVVNVRQARWLHNRMRLVSRLGGEGEAHCDDLGASLVDASFGEPTPGPAPDVFP
jgi:hypothetical protein